MELIEVKDKRCFYPVPCVRGLSSYLMPRHVRMFLSSPLREGTFSAWTLLSPYSCFYPVPCVRGLDDRKHK